MNYWEKRALERESLAFKKANITIDEVQKAYDRAFFNLEKEIKSINEELRKKGGKDAPDLEAYIYRMARIKEIEEKIYKEFSILREIEERKTKNLYIDLVRESYYQNIFDIQKGTGLRFNFTLLPRKAIEEVIRGNWKGSNFSKRIWKNTNIVAGKSKEIILSGLSSGAGNQDMTLELMRENLNSLRQTSKFVAERLIRTETNYFSNQGELISYEECGIKKYRFLATLDEITSKTCKKLDGKVFNTEDAKVNINYPPMHPFCRSTTVGVVDGEVLSNLKRRARDPGTGKTYLVDGDMDYKTWFEENVKSNHESYVGYQKSRNERSDKIQFENYTQRLGKEAPKSFADFQDLKYNDIKEWELLKKEYKFRGRIRTLPEQVPYVWQGEEGFIPTGTKIESAIPIAGKGDRNKKAFRNAISRSEEYGGLSDEWSKMAGTVISDRYKFEVHWDEHDGKMYKTKVKNRKDKR